MSRINTPSRSHLTEIVEALKPRTIDCLVDLKDRVEFRVLSAPACLLVTRRVLLYDLIGFRRYPSFEVLYVARVVERAELFWSGFATMVHFEVRSECIVFDEAVNHLHAFGFHGMFLTELVLGDVLVIEVAHVPH